MQYLAIDIGGTSIKYGLVDHTGELSQQGKMPTTKTNADDFFADLSKLIARFPEVSGIGFALPGAVDTRTNRVTACASLPFLEHLPFAAQLTLPRTVPVTLINDGDAAALAEFWQGELTGINTGAMVVLGTGVGAALFLNGQLYRRVSEPSFMVLDGLLPVTRANTAAPLSAVATVGAMANAMAITGTNQGERVFAGLPTAGPTAEAILDKFVHGVAAMIYNMHTVLDLEKVVIGGGISAQPLLITKLQAAVEAYRTVTPLAKRSLAELPIAAARYRNEANLIGAVVPLIKPA